MKAPLAIWLTAIAVLVWLAIPAPSSFERRWVAMPAAMSFELFSNARRASERPAARRGFCYPAKCLNG